MKSFLQIARVLGVNAIPAGGFFLDGWAPSTALGLYWLETLLGAILWSLRIGLHARLTRKRGHILDPDPPQRRKNRPVAGRGSRKARLAAELGFVDDLRPPPRSMRRYMVHYAGIVLLLTLAQGIFVAILLFGMLETKPDLAALRTGAMVLLAILAAGFLYDLTTLRTWSFTELKNRAGAKVGRVFVMHFTILGGMPLLAWLGADAGIFGVFIGLKSATDVAGLLPWGRADADEPPAWLVRVLGRHGPEFARYWRDASVFEKRYAERCELTWDPDARHWVAPAPGGEPGSGDVTTSPPVR